MLSGDDEAVMDWKHRMVPFAKLQHHLFCYTTVYVLDMIAVTLEKYVLNSSMRSQDSVSYCGPVDFFIC